MKSIILAAAIALALPVAANAGTCDTPTPMSSNTTFSGTTCGGQIGINLGGTILSHPSQVYTFTGGAGATGSISLGGANLEMAISNSCTQAPFIDGYAGSDGPINLDALNLVDGQTYYFFVTTDPGINPTDPPTCADFTVVADTLPVNLQSVTVD